MRDLIKRVGKSTTAFTRGGGQRKDAEAGMPDARHLLDLLEQKKPRTGLQDADLRRLAAELVARVEQKETQTGPGRPSRPPRPSSDKPGSRFSNMDAPQSGQDAPEQTDTLSRKDIPKFARTARRVRNGAPADGLAEPQTRTNQALPATARQAKFAYQTQAELLSESVASRPIAPAKIDDLLSRAVRDDTLSAEHPAVIATALKNRSRREQAAALRKLPSTLARGVQRLLI